MARKFNGTSDQITFANNPLPGNGAFTAAGFFNLTGFSGNMILLNEGNPGADGWGILVGPSTPSAFVEFHGRVDSPSVTVPSSTWMHLALAFAGGSGQAMLWLNGATTAATFNSGLNAPSAGFAAIMSSAGTHFTTGLAAHCAMWSALLSPQEIYALAFGKLPLFVRPGSLAGYWPLDGYGHPALDLSYQKNNGILTGTTFATGPPFISSTPILTGALPSPNTATPPMFPFPPPAFTLMPQIVM